MPKLITIQIQLEPRTDIRASQLIRCKEAMEKAVQYIENIGFVRSEMYVGGVKYEEPKI